MPPKTKPAAGTLAPDDSAAPDAAQKNLPPPAVDGSAAAPDDSQGARLEIRCARATGIWRAGRFWPPELVTVSAAEFSAEQIAALKAEPLLSVQIQE